MSIISASPDLYNHNIKLRRLYGVLWFILSLLLDNINDVIMKYTSANLGVYEIVFFRFLFSLITLLPFVIMRKDSMRVSRLAIFVHFMRGALLFCGIALWCIGLGVVKIAVATSINFIIPIYILILSTVCLKEKFSALKLLSTLMGFIGTLIVMNPFSGEFNLMSAILLVSAFLFALLDILNKWFVEKETMINMLFYSSIFVFLFSIIPAYNNWVTPTISDLGLLVVLGATCNLILYCLLKSFEVIEISSVAPYRYVEIFFSVSMGYVIFGEVPHVSTIIGSVIIVSATLVLVYETIMVKNRP